LSNALQGLGFSEIEALVYGFLVGREPATGYRISHAIGKPTANTYKAIASLAQQGAVQVDEGGNRLIRAVPADELLSGLERRAREKREAARAALAERSADVADDRVYTLRARDQVLERARAMLGRAREIVLGDLFPGPLEALADDLAAVAARGVRVVVKVYSGLDVAGVAEIAEGDSARALAEWPGQQLSLVVDADEHLLALFDATLANVHQAVWSRSTFLSCLHHNHVAMELLHTAWRSRGSLAGSDALVGISLLSSRPPGLRRLQERAGGAFPTNPDGEDR
jgi:sugar-specific transcriptional regulator TrmB